ncbi:MAG: TrbG/VirB9 family P-type conjugative transfer protein [Sphingomonadales bacterium]|nr:TrbG/VirB9 family P-type conjugative transfer protein [Sphingomonadales bacterium]
MKRAFVVAALYFGAPAHAQMEPIPSNEDARIGVIHYANGQQINLRTTPGADLTVLFPHGEHVQLVTVGDTASWHVSVSSNQDAIVVYALHQVGATSLDVRTDKTGYQLNLTAVADARGPYLVRIEGESPFGNQPKPWAQRADARSSTYRLSGDKELRPKSIRDDGKKVYIEWGSDQSIPAVLARDKNGREEMVDGYMRDGTFTIDRIYDLLVFRIDKTEVLARRMLPKALKKSIS